TANENDIVFISSGIERGAGHFQNVGPTLREGVEANLDANVSPRIEAHVSYSWIDATFGESFTVASPNHPDAAGGEIPVRRGDRIPLIPRNTAKAELIWRATNAITFDAAFRMVSISFFRGDEGNLARPLPAYSVADAGVAWRGKHNLEFDATLRNVANARYATFGSFGDPSILGPGFDDPRFVTPGDPRTIVVGVRYRR
ncbi:MAG TPA: TonB-dependent receptor, partial [Thermoanaerobaculia bacterium]|nr:TonB-dependent receptor [Thermoanaerobaculia bacterium]